jgi:AcrR family transcriptional regulator
MMARRDSAATRDAVFTAAADLFSRHGFDGVTVDDIARAARVNRAMLYYHFSDKLALYRDIVCGMLDEAGARVTAIVDLPLSPPEKLERFIASFVALADSHPYFPPLMLREMAEGARRFDVDILSRMRRVFLAFMRVLSEGQQAELFREMNPVLAYLTIIGPVLVNAARERAADQPGRDQLPMFAAVPHDDLARHMTRVALQMLKRDP